MKKERIVVILTLALCFSPVYAQTAPNAGGGGGTASLEDELAAIRAELDALRVQVTNLKRETSAKQEELTYLQSVVSETSVALAELTRQKSALQDEVDELIRQKGSLSQLSTNVTAQNQQNTAPAAAPPVATAVPPLAAQNTTASLSQQQTQSVSSSNSSAGTVVNKIVQPPSPDMPVASLVKNSDDATLTLMAVVLFDPDNAFLGAANIGKVDEIGEKMAANPAMRIVIRGYAAPFGTEYGQLRVSEIRARVTMDYLMSMHDVSSARIVLEWVGAAEMPKNARIGVYEQYRAVDVFIR